MSETGRADKIAQLNDNFRSTFGANGEGTVVKTRGIDAFPEADQGHIFTLVQTFNTFTQDNDPYGEHDFGRVDYQEQAIYWKIDYYDPSMEKGSEDPADPQKTHRVMTIMLASEY